MSALATDDVRSLTAPQLDAIREVANIGAAHAATALSQMLGFMGMVLLPSPPKFTIERSSSVLSAAHLQFGIDADHVFCVENEFLMTGDEKLRGFFVLLPDAASLSAILRAVRVN